MIPLLLAIFFLVLVIKYSYGEDELDMVAKTVKGKIKEVCAKYNLDTAFWLALAEGETGFNPNFFQWDVNDYSAGVYSMQLRNWTAYGYVLGRPYSTASVEDATLVGVEYLAKMKVAREAKGIPTTPYPDWAYWAWVAPFQKVMSPKTVIYVSQMKARYAKYKGV